MDLYHIPGDTGENWRLNKFIEYQHEVPSIHYRVLGEYIKKYIHNKDDAVMMCWFMSSTYNEVTCMFLQEVFDWRNTTPTSVAKYCKNFWASYKDKLDFGSSRAYAKSMDWFPILMEGFIRRTRKQPYRWLKSLCNNSPEENYLNVFNNINKLPYTGRFSCELFMESVLYLQKFLDVELTETSKLDWKNCSNLTSGLLNIFYLDEEANYFDKHKTLPEGITEEFLTKKLNKVQKRISKVYPEQETDINLFVGKVCSFRNLFKASRYGGFHHDRELGVLKRYEATLPEYNWLWNRVYRLRESMFPKRLLGELNGWDGIRKERKKLWLRKGLTGVEKTDC